MIMYTTRTVHDVYDLLRFLDACIWTDLKSKIRTNLLYLAMHESARRTQQAYDEGRSTLEALATMRKVSAICENAAIWLVRAEDNDNLPYMRSQLTAEIMGGIAPIRRTGFEFVPFAVQVPSSWAWPGAEVPLALHFRMESAPV